MQPSNPLPPASHSKFYFKSPLVCMALWGECLWSAPLSGITPRTKVCEKSERVKTERLLLACLFIVICCASLHAVKGTRAATDPTTFACSSRNHIEHLELIHHITTPYTLHYPKQTSSFSLPFDKLIALV